MYTTCSELVGFIYWTGKSMNNLMSFCGLLDVRINASDKDLPVQELFEYFSYLVITLMFGPSTNNPNAQS